MPLHLLFAFAFIQGFTEFLPVSSSGHLQLLWAWVDASPNVLPSPRDLLGYEIAAHLGTLLAVLLYCADDLWRLLGGLWTALRRRRMNPQARIVLLLAVATVPLFLAGWFLRDLIAEHTRNALFVVAWANLLFALLLWLADSLCLRIRQAEHLNFGGALLIGIFQAFALVPGVSRAGAIITAARFLSCERAEAARVALLLSIPAILGAGTVASLEADRLTTPFSVFALVAGLSFAVALPTIFVLMRWLKQRTYFPFVAYRLLFAAGLFLALYYGFLS